jgi:DNA-binding NtrC family response regulator
VLTADSGERAVEMLKSERVDAVTLDLKMPGLGGQNTLSLIREIEPALPVVIITGYGSYESAVKAIQYRAFDYISKPFDSRRTVEVVTSAVEARRRRELGESTLLAPLDEALETVDRLEWALSRRLSSDERASFHTLRDTLRSMRDEVAGRAAEDRTFDLFAHGKGLG